MGVSTPIYTAIAVEYSITGMRIKYGSKIKQNKKQNYGTEKLTGYGVDCFGCQTTASSTSEK